MKNHKIVWRHIRDYNLIDFMFDFFRNKVCGKIGIFNV